MTGLLELREKIKVIYSKYEVFILPVVKFLLAFLVLNTLNGQLGYMTQLDNIALVLIVALACSFLPIGSIVLFAVVFSLMHMYALSLEVALVGLCMYLLMFLLFFRISPRESLVVVLTPLLFLLKIPYVMPVAMGLLGTPASMVSVGCGVAIYYLIQTVSQNASTINTMSAEDAAAKIRLLIDGLLDNKAMLIMITAFAITVVVVYLIRRMSVDYSWTIGIIAGAMINMLILLLGDLLYDTNISVGGVIIGVVVAVLAGKVIEFFRLSLDYSRTEKVQFEDDEYYYYVKAVPKMSVATPTKTVKKINTQSRISESAVKNSTTASGVGSTRSVTTERTTSGAGSTRSVTTERISSGIGNTRNVGSERTVSGTGNTRNVGSERTVSGTGNTRNVGSERISSGTGNTRNVGSDRTVSGTGNTRNVGSERTASGTGNTRNVGSERTASGTGNTRNVGSDRTTSGTGNRRNVTTERTATARNTTQTQRGQSNYNRRNEHTTSGRSVTINSSMTDKNTEEYEDLF